MALALALAKRPRLLLLDEPVASLDPLARREFLQALMGSVADTGTTVLLSSHLLADLERVCDYLIVLNSAQVQLVGTVDELVAEHCTLVGPRHDGEPIPGVASDRPGQPHRPAVHAAGAHQRAGHGPGLDRARGDPGGPDPHLPRRGRDPRQPRGMGGDGMIWLAWRQHRKQALFTGVGLVVLAALMLPSGSAMHNTYTDKGLAACLVKMSDPKTIAGDRWSGATTRWTSSPTSTAR